MEKDKKAYLIDVLIAAATVITNPADFFRKMSKEGGFAEPLIFMVSMGIIAGIIRAFLAVVGVGIKTSFMMALGSIIIMPFLVAIFSFIGAAILFVIWKLMGSQESYETAYRCGAYAGAIVPITTLLGIIPYLGTIITLIWTAYLMVTASIVVHQLNQKTAWIIFGTICGLFALTSTCAELQSRKIQKDMGKWENKMENMTPEEAGKAVGEFLKGLEQGSGEKLLNNNQ